LKEREVAIAFNMGLKTVIYILEKAEALSAKGGRFLIEESRRQIANNG
jgi:hypothetical protein